MDNAIVVEDAKLSDEQAARLAQQALEQTQQEQLLIDCSQVCDADVFGFARLVLLRRELIARGADLLLSNLHDRAASVYEVNKLAGVLPRVPVE